MYCSSVFCCIPPVYQTSHVARMSTYARKLQGSMEAVLEVLKTADVLTWMQTVLSLRSSNLFRSVQRLRCDVPRKNNTKKRHAHPPKTQSRRPFFMLHPGSAVIPPRTRRMAMPIPVPAGIRMRRRRLLRIRLDRMWRLMHQMRLLLLLLLIRRLMMVVMALRRQRRRVLLVAPSAAATPAPSPAAAPPLRVFAIFGENPPGVQHGGDPDEQHEQDVEQELAAAAAFQEHGERGDEDCYDG